jgi:hypothetical protein
MTAAISRNASRAFTTADFARTCGIREERALLILRGFQAVGVVERRRSKWIATEYGLALSRGLALAAPEKATAA